MLFERDHELEALNELMAAAAAGRGQVAVICGGPATGRTELLHAFTEAVDAPDVLVLAAGGAGAERDLPMGVIGQLLHSAPLPADVLAKGDGLVADAAGARDADPRAVHGLCALLLDLAADRPVVLALDDVQHADVASLQVLLCLRRRMRSARLLLVMTEGRRPGSTRSAGHAEVVRQPQRRLTLAPLSPAGLAGMVTGLLGAPAAGLAPAFTRLTGGNPLLARALVEDQARAVRPQGMQTEPVIGPVFRQEVLDCLHRAGPEVAEVAGGLALLGRWAGPELLGRLLECGGHQVGPVLDVLRDAGLLDGDRFRDPVLDAVVLEGLTLDGLDESARLHLRAAGLLHDSGVDAVAVARHLIAADAVPAPWGVTVLRRAAEQTVADDHRFAVRCLELGLRACDDEAERTAVRVALVRVAWWANPSAAAPHLDRLGAAVDAGALGWRDAVPVIRHLLWQGDLAGAADRMRAARAALGDADPQSLAELRFTTEWLYGRAHDRLPADVRGWLTARDPDTPSHPDTLTVSRSGGPAATGSAEHILQSGLGDVPPEIGTRAILTLEWADRQDRARFWSVVLAEEAGRRRATTWSALLGCARAELAWRRGDLAGADALAAAALESMPAQSWGVLAGLPLSIMVLARTAMGRHADAAEVLERPVPEAMAETVVGARYLHAAGYHSLACDRPLAAVDQLERCGALLKRLDVDVPAMVPWRSDLGRAYLTIGMRQKGRDLPTEQLERGGTRTRAASLRVLAAAGDVRNRAAMLREAVQLLERCGDRLELARALSDLSQVHRESGELGEARLLLRRAKQELKACQAVVPAPRPPQSPAAQSREVAPAAETADVAVLSEAERNVAALAALGHTNREIGRTLYITVSTVEQHLTRVYRKLNVARRTELPAKLAQHDIAVPGAAERRALVS